MKTIQQQQTAMTNPVTAVGDIVIGGASGAPSKLVVPTVDSYLSVDSNNPKWGNGVTDENTKLLIRNSLTDSSFSNKTLTISGTFPPIVNPNGGPFGGPCIYFNGSTNSFINAGNVPDFDLTKNDFTIDLWFKCNVVNVLQTILAKATNSGSSTNSCISIYVQATGYIGAWIGNGTTGATTITSADKLLIANTWYHLALTRQGNVFSLYINGTLVKNATYTTFGNGSAPLIVGANDGTVPTVFSGYMSDIRVSSVCRWTTNFAPPTASYSLNVANPMTMAGDIVVAGSGAEPVAVRATNINQNIVVGKTVVAQDSYSDGYTKLLMHMDGVQGQSSFVDVNENTITTGGTPIISTAKSVFGSGSLYLDGNTYLLVNPKNVSDFSFPPGTDFTIDFWLWPTALNVAVIDFRTGTKSFALYTYTNNSMMLYRDNVVASTTANNTLTLNAWNHFALIRYAGNIMMYLNGVQSGAILSDTLDYVCLSNRPVIGASGPDYTQKFPGYIDELRISKGIARWTSNFVPPTSAYGGAQVLQNPMNATGDLMFQNYGTVAKLGVSKGKSVLSNGQELTISDPIVGSSGIDGYTKLVINGFAPTTDIATSKTITNTAVTVDNTNTVLGQGSMLFNGTTSYLNLVNSNDFNFGSSDFTIDFRMRLTTLSVRNPVVSFSTDSIFTMVVETNNKMSYIVPFTPLGWANRYGSTTFAINTWYHVAFVRKGSEIFGFVNGALDYYESGIGGSISPGATTLFIGKHPVGWFINGNISEFRVSTGVARWTTTFVPPTTVYGTGSTLLNPMTAQGDIVVGGVNGIPTKLINSSGKNSVLLNNGQRTDYVGAVVEGLGETDTYTKLLLHFDGNSVDSSGTNKVVNTVGSPTYSSAISKFGGSSIYINSASNYLAIPYTSDLDFGTNDFTIDMWCYTDGSAGGTYKTLFLKGDDATDFGSPRIDGYNGVFTIRFANNAGTAWGNEITTSAYSNNVWNHLAVVRSGTNLYAFINGVLSGSTTYSGAMYPFSSTGIRIGNMGTEFWNGYIDELRISNGIARWTSNFVPPTSTAVVRQSPNPQQLIIGSVDAKGRGTINAQAVYANGGTPTCYPLEYYLTGSVDKDFWYPTKEIVPGAPEAVDELGNVIPGVPEQVIYSGNPGLDKYLARIADNDNPNEIVNFVRHWRTKGHLTALPNKDKYVEENRPSTDGYVQRLLETIDLFAIHIKELKSRINAVSQRIGE